MDRTGVMFAYRQCPRHGGELELCVNDGQGVSNIGWWCDQCQGTWLEPYFTMKVEAALPVMPLHRQFEMSCPRCSSRRVARACSPDCCNWHRCEDCEQHFDILVELVENSPLSDEELQSLAGKSWLEGTVFYPRSDLEQFEKIQRTYPKCGCCDNREPLLFAVDHGVRDERYRFGWFCGKCETFNFDYSDPSHERGRWFFMLGDRPDLRCPACGHSAFEQGGDLCDATCVTCRSVLRLKVEPTAGSGAPEGES